MERTKLLTYAVVALLLMNVGIIGWMVFRRPPHGPRREPKAVIIERLKLDAAQQDAYSRLVTAHQQAFRPLMDNGAKLRHEYFDLLKNEAINAASADSLNRLISDNQYQINQINLQHFKDIKALCNANQKAAFDSFVDEMAALFRTGPGSDGPPPPPH